MANRGDAMLADEAIYLRVISKPISHLSVEDHSLLNRLDSELKWACRQRPPHPAHIAFESRIVNAISQKVHNGYELSSVEHRICARPNNRQAARDHRARALENVDQINERAEQSQADARNWQQLYIAKEAENRALRASMDELTERLRQTEHQLHQCQSQTPQQYGYESQRQAVVAETWKVEEMGRVGSSHSHTSNYGRENWQVEEMGRARISHSHPSNYGRENWQVEEIGRAGSSHSHPSNYSRENNAIHTWFMNASLDSSYGQPTELEDEQHPSGDSSAWDDIE